MVPGVRVAFGNPLGFVCWLEAGRLLPLRCGFGFIFDDHSGSSGQWCARDGNVMVLQWNGLMQPQR